MLQSKLALLAVDPKNVGRLCDMIGDMPNIDFPTMGGLCFGIRLHLQMAGNCKKIS